MKNLIPIHVAIVMDGNRRWAKQRGLNVIEGHRKGIDALIKTVETASKLGIKYVTAYALSAENYQNRSNDEIKVLLELIKEGFTQHLMRLKKDGAKIACIGELKALPLPVRKVIESGINRLASGNKCVVTIAINYGGRDEILMAAEKLSKQNLPFTEEEFNNKLYTRGIPDPDILIRTGGTKRLSNFLLWQLSYSELYFTDTLWPDFERSEFETIIKKFGKVKRNFGV